jgi:response regulator RpfG family c-di-GMP phosphodiesterase
VELVRNVVLLILAAILLAQFLVTVYIVRNYESGLAQINQNLEQTVDRRSQALMKTRDAVIFGMANLAESRDQETGEHLERMFAYVAVLADELGKSNPELDERTNAMMALTSSLHDVGKVGVPDAVLCKPGELTPEERKIVEKHPLIGGDSLFAIKQRLGEDDFLILACEIAFAHHERWDGTGYPFGLQGEEIPLSARVVALADVYDAIISKRVYKRAMSHEEARDIIVEKSGSHFDPKVVEAFLAREEDFRAIGSGQSDLLMPDQRPLPPLSQAVNLERRPPPP